MWQKSLVLLLVILGMASAPRARAGTEMVEPDTAPAPRYNYAPRPVYYPRPLIGVAVYPRFGYYPRPFYYGHRHFYGRRGYWRGHHWR